MAEAPLRVLYAHHAPMQGGAEGSLLCLLRHLSPGDVTPVLASPPGGLLDAPGAAGHAQIEAVPEWRPRRSASPARLMQDYRGLRRLAARLEDIIARHDIALVHANSWQAALAASRAVGERPLLWHCRDLRVPGIVTRTLRGRCTGVIAISQAVREFVLSRGFAPERVHLVYNGIDAAELRPVQSPEEVRAALQIPPGAPLVVSVGQLVPWKRHDLLLEAARLVRGQAPEARFVLVGGEPPGAEGRRATLEALARRLGVLDAVQFTGYRPDAADIINAADVLAHAASAEPLGRVILESMALGTPVVAPRAAGPAELIEHEDSGLLVAPDDAGALAAGILRMLGEPALAARCAAGALRRVQERFSAQAMARETLGVYRHVLEMSGS